MTSGQATLLGTVILKNLALPSSQELSLQLSDSNDSPSSPPPYSASQIVGTTSPKSSNIFINSSVTLGQVGPNSVNLYTGFYGIDETQSGWNPPDVQVATGPNNVMELVNGRGEVWDKQGNSIHSFYLCNLFKAPNYCSDPRLIYDTMSGRWFASVTTASTYNDLRISVSASSDPTGTWYVYQVKSINGGSNFDYDQFGLSSDKVAINAQSGTGTKGDEYFILSKSEITAGNSKVDFADFGPSNSVIRIDPAVSVTSSSTLYMVSSCSGSCGGGSTKLHVFYVTGVPPGTVTSTEYTISMNAANGAQWGQQPGTSNLLNVGDASVQSAVWANNNNYVVGLWLSFTDSCTPSGDNVARACLRFIELSTSGSPSIVQQWDDGSKGTYFFYPSLRLDLEGDLDVIYGYSSSTQYPAVAITGQTVFDSLNTLDFTWYIYFSLPASEPTNRYGDYFGASVDPSNPKLIWLAGEYGSEYSGTYHWSTDIISAIVGTFVQTLVTCGSTGGGSYSNCGAVTGAPDSNLVNLHASNCKSPCDSAWVVGDFGNTYITGDMLIDGYSYNNGVNAYYSNVIVNVSSDDVHWSTVYNQVWNPSSTNRPAWVDIGHITNVRYVKIIAQDNGDSANLYIDSVDIG